MCPVLLIILIFTIINNSYGNPIYNIDSLTDIDDSESQSHLACNENSMSTDNNTLIELLNNNRYWFVLARSKRIYGEQTWNNALMKTSTTTNGTIYLEFIGENINGSCTNSERVDILSSAQSNRVFINWPNDKALIHLIFCYSIESYETNVCAQNQTEHFFIQNNEEEHENDTIFRLKAHCFSINLDEFIVNDNPKKCVPIVSPPEIVDNTSVEQSAETTSEASFQTTNTDPGTIEQENTTDTLISDLDLTMRTNRTNRLETLDEYYNNVTTNWPNEDQSEQIIAIKTKHSVVLKDDPSFSEKPNEADFINIEQNENVTNEIIDKNVPPLIFDKLLATQTTTEVLLDSLTTIQNVSTQIMNKNSFTEDHINIINSLKSSTTSVPPAIDKAMSNTLIKSDPVEESIMLPNISYEKSTTFFIETTVELTTAKITTTTVVPADCPILSDCPVDYCAFGRKLDNHGCPTCNCLQSNKSNTTCSILTCQECLYGHYTDPYGCPTCQCQARPYPPLGERCPQYNCEPCYFGTVKDEYNCDTCVCIRPNNQECPVLNCAFGSCKYGSIKDEDECPTCDCLLPTTDINQVHCSTTLSCPPCHLGYVTDADGCQTCQCKSRGSAPCGSISSQCQCEYGSYLNSDGCETCSCLPDPKSASRQACWELLNEANFYNASGPKCTSDGSFYGRQCSESQSKCWCVTPNGIRISGFESKPEENVNCGCAVELYQVSSLRMIGHHLSCLLNGNYAPIQCDGRYCSCIDENGKLIGPTVSFQKRDQLRCVGVYQQLHPERFLLHRANIEQSDGSRYPYGILSSLCLTHLEQVRNTKTIDDHMLIPICDANGFYAPVQCDQSERYCWCVDKKTGVEMDGTRRLNARPNCNNI